MKKLAICVGINDYPSHPLDYCELDASEIANALSMSEYGFDIIRLLGVDATRKNLKKTLDQNLRSSADLILFYFSGHGWRTPSGGYLVSVDAEPFDEGVSFDYLRRSIDSNCPKETSFVFILDCCHAGGASAKGKEAGVSPVTADDMTVELCPSGTGRVVLAACQENALSFEIPAFKHGIFTYYLLEGLLGSSADSVGDITVGALYDHVAHAMKSKGYQTPVFKGDITGKLILGSGFQPIEKIVLNEKEASELEREAEIHLEDFQRKFTLSCELQEWQRRGHRDACRALEPILTWFINRFREYPQLSSRSQFINHYTNLLSRLARMGAIDVGTVTTHGILERQLGAGTFGNVYKVKPRPPYQEPFAYKVYHPHDINNKEKLKRFRRGYDAMRQLDHQHIVKVYEYTECPVGFYMDFVDGPNLRDFAGSLESVEILKVLLTVGETLTHTHGRDIVHRDVKPENIIMYYDPNVETWRPYLTDFDLAWFSTATKLTREGVGTLHYAAPEQLTKYASASAHAKTTDVYAFGQLCFYAVCANDPVPFDQAANLRALERRLANWHIEGAARNFYKLYERCTKHEPKERFQSFRKICDITYELIRMLEAMDTCETISTDRFFRELSFSVIGLTPEKLKNTDSFESISGKSLIKLDFRNVCTDKSDLVLDVANKEKLLVAGATSHEQGRNILNRRVDTALKEFPGAKRKSGQDAAYSVIVTYPKAPLSLLGVQKARQLLTRVTDSVE